MLSTAEFVKTPTGDRLLKIWEQRYVPDLSSLCSTQEPCFYNSLLESLLPAGRAATAAKLRDNLLDNKCQMAWIQAKALYSYIPNILDLNEARQITEVAFRIYKQLLEIYQQESVTDTSFLHPSYHSQGNSLPLWGTIAIDQLAFALEPILLVFQEQLIATKDWRTVGFMTTQLQLTNKLILSRLTASEKVLFGSYLQFVEELVSIPWLRICADGSQHELDSPAIGLLTQMLPLSEEISQTVYKQMVEMYPSHSSRRGVLTNLDVAHSCIRDLNMFQAYLWLSVVQGRLAPVEQELVVLCVMVMESVGVKLEMTQQWTQLLINEINIRVSPEYKSLLQPYCQGMIDAFGNKNKRLGLDIAKLVNQGNNLRQAG